MPLQGCSIKSEQAFPIEFRWNDGRAIIGGLGLLISHFEEQQERNLFGIRHVRETIVPQNMGEIPGFIDDLLRVVAHQCFLSDMTCYGQFY